MRDRLQHAHSQRMPRRLTRTHRGPSICIVVFRSAGSYTQATTDIFPPGHRPRNDGALNFFPARPISVSIHLSLPTSRLPCTGIYMYLSSRTSSSPAHALGCRRIAGELYRRRYRIYASEWTLIKNQQNMEHFRNTDPSANLGHNRHLRKPRPQPPPATTITASYRTMPAQILSRARPQCRAPKP